MGSLAASELARPMLRQEGILQAFLGGVDQIGACEVAVLERGSCAIGVP